MEGIVQWEVATVEIFINFYIAKTYKTGIVKFVLLDPLGN